MVRLLSLESCCGRPKIEKLSFRRIKRHEIGIPEETIHTFVKTR